MATTLPATPLLLALAALTLPAASPPPPSPAALPSPTSSVPPAEDLALHRMTGVVLPEKQVMLHAPLPGVLVELAVEEGQAVQQGQLLARLNDDMQRARVEAAQLAAQSTSEVKRAQLAWEEAKILTENIENIHSKEAASEWEVRRMRLQRDQAEMQFHLAQEQHQVDQVTLKREQASLDLYSIKAPFAGRVTRVAVENGVSLTTETPILLLAQITSLKAQLYLPIELYGKLAVGQTYSLAAGEPVNRTLSATLKTIDPIIDPASRTFRCVFTIPNPDESLPAGFSVRLLLDAPPQ